MYFHRFRLRFQVWSPPSSPSTKSMRATSDSCTGKASRVSWPRSTTTCSGSIATRTSSSCRWAGHIFDWFPLMNYVGTFFTGLCPLHTLRHFPPNIPHTFCAVLLFVHSFIHYIFVIPPPSIHLFITNLDIQSCLPTFLFLPSGNGDWGYRRRGVYGLRHYPDGADGLLKGEEEQEEESGKNLYTNYAKMQEQKSPQKCKEFMIKNQMQKSLY